MAASQQSSMPISCPHSVTECMSDTVSRPSMEQEVERLLFSALPNMSEQSCLPVSPRRPPPMVPNTPSASKEKAPPDLGEIIPVYLKQLPPSPQESSQAGKSTLELIPAAPPPLCQLLWRGTAPPTP